MKRTTLAFKMLTFILCTFFSKSILSQGAPAPVENKYCFGFKTSYINPFLKESSFERIGSILSLSGGWAYRITNNPVDNKYIAFKLGSSIFIPKDGGSIDSPKVLPKATLQFLNTKSISSFLSVGHIYNPSLGIQADVDLIIDNKSSVIWKGYFLGVNQTFDLKPGETSSTPPSSWLGVTGLKAIIPFGKNKKWTAVGKAGFGFRGDSDEDTKAVGNGAIVLAYDFISIVGSYQNNVPDRGFPSYFVSVVQVDLTRLYRMATKTDCHLKTSILNM